MEELTKLLTSIELTADDIVDTKQQLINLDARRHKTREALNTVKEQLKNKNTNTNKKHWVCVGDMFIRLNTNDTRNTILDDQYHTEQGVEKLRVELKEKVDKLRQLEGKPELTGFHLKPLKKEEIASFRQAFKI